MLCHYYYEEHVVASFAQKIQSEYYGANIYVSIEGIDLEHFSATDQETSSYFFHSCTDHPMCSLIFVR